MGVVRCQSVEPSVRKVEAKRQSSEKWRKDKMQISFGEKVPYEDDEDACRELVYKYVS